MGIDKYLKTILDVLVVLSLTYKSVLNVKYSHQLELSPLGINIIYERIHSCKLSQ